MSFADGKRCDWADRPRGIWAINRSSHNYDTGSIWTPHGFVDAYAQGDDRHFHHTRLDFAHGGRTYSVFWRRRYTRRGMVTLAQKFAEEVVSPTPAEGDGV